MKLVVGSEIPTEVLQLPATELHRHLGGPTLYSIQGRRPEPIFISVLMHGNETVGWEAICQLLLHYRVRQLELPRSIELFIGNTQAAETGSRHIEGQPDYNRVWPGSDLPPCAEQELMQEVVNRMTKRQVFASIDIHNNTGLNPHYACINQLLEEDLSLASLFGRVLVYFTRPKGVQSMAMSKLCPAVTLECGKVGEQLGVEHAMEFIDACLHLAVMPAGPHSFSGAELFQTVAAVRVPPNIEFGFGSADCTLNFDPGLDHCNFRLMQTGWRLASVSSAEGQFLQVTDTQGLDVFDQYFQLEDGAIYSRKPLMPSMLTSEIEVIKQDCLCYLMEPVDLSNKDILRRSPR